MGEPLCKPCKDRGRICLAHRIVDGTPMCNECFAGKPSNGVRTELAAEVLKKKEEGEAMGRNGKHLGIDWGKVQEERNGGASAKDLAEKFGCHVSLVHARTRPAKASRAGVLHVPKVPRPLGAAMHRNLPTAVAA